MSYLETEEFLREMEKVARESFRVLKPGKHWAILIGDTRKKRHVIPLGFRLIDVNLKVGFRLKELVIKRQHNCKTTGFGYANSIKHNFSFSRMNIYLFLRSLIRRIENTKQRQRSIGEISAFARLS